MILSDNSMYVGVVLRAFHRRDDGGGVEVRGHGTFGSGDGTGTAVAVHFPRGMTWAFAAGTFLFGQRFQSAVRMVTTPGAVVTTIAGDGTNGYANGVGTAAKFNQRIWKESGSTRLS